MCTLDRVIVVLSSEFMLFHRFRNNSHVFTSPPPPIFKRFKFHGPRHLVAWDCNCSICRMRRNTHIIVSRDAMQVTVTTGHPVDHQITEYQVRYFYFYLYLYLYLCICASQTVRILSKYSSTQTRHATCFAKPAASLHFTTLAQTPLHSLSHYIALTKIHYTL